MKKFSTKKALIMSMLSMLLCVSMLVGSTFAWFTDTASATVNTIQAGTLDVALYYEDTDGNWQNAEGGTLGWAQKTAGGSTTVVTEDGLPLWEPGCTFSLPRLKIVNEGNLALKYKIAISGITGDAKLLEVIDFTMQLDGTDEILGTEHSLAAKSVSGSATTYDEDIFTISGHMDENAGNDYQGLSIEGISIMVVATQLDYEYDSEDNDYDKDSTYLNQDADGAYLIGSVGDLRYFAATVNANNSAYAGKTIKLTSNIDLGGANWTPMVANGLILDGQNHTISNFKATGTYNVGLFGSAQSCTIKNLKVSEATVTGINQAGAIVGSGICANIDNCEVTSSTVTNKNVDDNGDKVGAIIGYLSAEQSASVTGCKVSNCILKGYRDVGGLIGMANVDGSGAWTVTGNTVENTTVINDRSIQSRTIADDAYNIGEIIGRRAGSSNTENTNTATNVAISVIGENNAIVTTGDNANIVVADTAVIDSSTSIGKGTTISGTGVDSTTVAVEKAKVAKDDVTIKDMTINGSGSSGNEGTLGINGNNTTVENVNYVGDGNIAVTVSTGANNSGTTFKGVKITNAFRGIQFWSLSGNSLIEDCEIDVAGYTFNVDAVVAGATLTIKNSTLNGWTSYTSGISKVSFVGCKLGLNTYQYLRPYSTTELTNCEFTSNDYELNAGGSGTYTITLTNCTKNGTSITAENVKTLLLDASTWNSNVTLIVNGTTVTVS